MRSLLIKQLLAPRDVKFVPEWLCLKKNACFLPPFRMMPTIKIYSPSQGWKRILSYLQASIFMTLLNAKFHSSKTKNKQKHVEVKAAIGYNNKKISPSPLNQQMSS